MLDNMINPKHFYYTLDKLKNVVPCGANELELLLQDPDKRIVKQEYVDKKFISTVFLGIDHSFNKNILHVFETMVFDESGDKPRMEIYCTRYATWKEAEKGHKKAVKWVKDGCKDEDECDD
jgi:hypothetical protein